MRNEGYANLESLCQETLFLNISLELSFLMALFRLMIYCIQCCYHTINHNVDATGDHCDTTFLAYFEHCAYDKNPHES